MTIMDLYSTFLICCTVLVGLAMACGALIACFRSLVRYEERANIREQETAAQKAQLYAQKDISKAYLENMAANFGMYPPDMGESPPEDPATSILNFVSTPQGQEILKKLGIDLSQTQK